MKVAKCGKKADGVLGVVIDVPVDRGNKNAQSLTVREVALRLDPDRFRVTLFYFTEPDGRLVGREYLRLVRIRSWRLAWVQVAAELARSRGVYYFVAGARDYQRLFLRAGLLRRLGVASMTTLNCWVTGKDPRLSRFLEMEPGQAKRLESAMTETDAVFTLSNGLADNLLEVFGRKADGTVVSGVDTRAFSPGQAGGSDRPRPRVLFAGSLQKRKRPGLVLEAAARHPGADFLVVGKGPLGRELESERQRRGLANVSLRGNVEQRELADLMRGSDLFLFPSLVEGSPKVTVEAAASGLPVILFDSYRPETVLDGRTGYVVRDEAEMMERLERLLGDSELRRRLGEAARRHAVENFDYDRAVRTWEEAFRLTATRLPGRRLP